MRWPLRRRPSLAGLLTLVVAMLLVRLYFWRLDGYLINDDEGSYLYAAWRIALGAASAIRWRSNGCLTIVRALG